MSRSLNEGALSRRDFLRKGAAATAATLGAAALPGVRAESRTTLSHQEVRYLERFPGVPFNPLQIEGGPFEDTLGEQPTGYWFRAKTGMRVATVVDSSLAWLPVRSDLYGPGLEDHPGGFPGYPALKNRWNRIETDIVAAGDYFLVVRKGEGAPSGATEITVRAEDVYRHRIQESFLFYPNKQPEPVIFSPDQIKVFFNGDFGVVLDFNQDAFSRAQDWEIKVYAQKGGPEQVTAPKVSSPEQNPGNEIPYLEDWLDRQRVIMFPAKKRPEGTSQSVTPRNELEMLKEWPRGSHIAVVVQNKKTGRGWNTRFFTL